MSRVKSLSFQTFKSHVLPFTYKQHLQAQRTKWKIACGATLGMSSLFKLAISTIRKRYLGKVLLPSAFYSEQSRIKGDRLKRDALGVNSYPAEIVNKEGIKLDAFISLTGSDLNKWIIFCCGNGESYPHSMVGRTKLAKDVGANLIFFDYRGVGRSLGNPGKPDDLVLDTMACVDYVMREKGAKEEDILLYGFSLGGAVAVVTTSFFKKVNVFSERSLASGADTMRHLIQGLAGIIIAMAVKILGSNIDALAAWDKIESDRKMLSYHRYDKVVVYAVSLYKRIKETTKLKFCERTATNSKGKISLKEAFKPKGVKIYQAYSGVEKTESGERNILVDTCKNRRKGELPFKPLIHSKNHVIPLNELDSNAYEATVAASKKLLGISK